MSVIMYVDFPHNGPFGGELGEQLKELALSINEESGIIWKIWTEDERDQTAGGVYMFDSEQNAKKYLDMHTKRLKQWGYTNIRGRIFDINDTLSRINKSKID